MQSKQNKLIKVNNQVLKRTDNIISITNKILGEFINPTKADFEWWNSLDDLWKKMFNYYLKNDRIYFNVSKDSPYYLNSIPGIIEKGSINIPNNNDFKQILYSTNLNLRYWNFENITHLKCKLPQIRTV